MVNGYNNQNGNGHNDPAIQQEDFDKLSTRSWPIQRANNQINPASLYPPAPDNSGPVANQQMPAASWPVSKPSMPGFSGQFMNGPVSPNPGQFSNTPVSINPGPGQFSNGSVPPNPGQLSNVPMPVNPGQFSNVPVPINPMALPPQWQGWQTTAISFVDPRQLPGQGQMYAPNMQFAAYQDVSLPPQTEAKKNKPLIIISTITLIVILLGGVGFYYWQKTHKANDVTLYQVNNQNATQNVGGSGIAFANQQLNPSYPLVERILQVYVIAGAHVNKGQPLLQIDASQSNAQLAESLNEANNALSFLYAVENKPNPDPVNIASARQSYNVAEGKYQLLKTQLSTFTTNNGNLIAPVNGIVTTVAATPGTFFPGGTSLLTILDESTIIVHAELPLAYLHQVSIGQSATVTPSALPNLQLTGKVTTIIPQANAQTDTFEIWVSVPNANGIFLPGMTAFVGIQKPVHAYIVPRLAVLNPDRESVVFVIHNDLAYLQHVHVVGRSYNAYYIDSGLSAGDKIVLTGLDQVQNGQPIHISKVETSIS
ncbi:MAG: efflux RND transporter periplasmic adaptor subunit [Ktedonobacteraceae bacterium]